MVPCVKGFTRWTKTNGPLSRPTTTILRGVSCMRNLKNPEGSEKQCGMPIIVQLYLDMKAIAAALEKDDQGKKTRNATEERGDAPPAAGVVKSGVVGSEAWTAGRYVAKDGQRFRIGRAFKTTLVFCGPGDPASKKAATLNYEAVPRRDSI